MVSIYIRNDLHVCPCPLSLDTYNICEYDCRFCLYGDTHVATPNGSVQICKIQIGNEILSFNLNEYKVEPTKVMNVSKRVYKKEKLRIVVMYKKRKRILKVTSEHPIYTERGWVEASNILVGDKVIFYLSHPATRMSLEARKTLSDRMKAKNPMFDKTISSRVGGWNKGKPANFTSEAIFNITKSARQRALEKNPMWNKETATKMAKTRSERIKAGQIDLTNALKRLDEVRLIPITIKKRLEGLMKRPTKPEGLLIDLFEKWNIPLKYVGDRSYLIGRYCPAFINEDLKAVVEFDGEIHEVFDTPEKKLIRSHFIESKGFKILTLKTEDLSNLEELRLKVSTFLSGFDPEWGLVTKKDYVRRSAITVYNLETENNQNFFANSVLVHNCFIKQMEKGWLKNKTTNGIKPINLKMVEQYLQHASRQEEKWDSSLVKAIRKLPIIIGRKCEPFCSYEEKYSATYLTLRLIANYGFKAVVETRQTKGVLEALSKVEVAGANLSILFGDDSVRKRMEPELPPYEERFELARQLKSIGLYVGLIAEPLIPTLNDKPEFYEDYAIKASEIGVDHVNFGELRVQNIKIAAEMFSEGGLDLVEVVRGKNHWKEDGLKIFETFKNKGVKISTPDWVNFYNMNDCRGCCGLDKFGFHQFTFQHALDLLKQKDSKVTFEDMLKYSIFDLKEEERFRKIWNGDSRYYNLADVEGIKKSNNSHGIRYEKEN